MLIINVLEIKMIDKAVEIDYVVAFVIHYVITLHRSMSLCFI